MTQQVITEQKKRIILRKIFVLMMTSLAGLNIFTLVDHFGIRGLDWEHYAVMVFGCIAALAAWTIWPKARK